MHNWHMHPAEALKLIRQRTLCLQTDLRAGITCN